MHAARTRPEIALVVGDLGYGVVEPFADEFPERFFNAGVAEQNMVGLAAGMASEGYHIFTYSIANFPTFRCAEQLRNDVDYHNLAVTTVAVGGGVGYGALGYSHHAVQDYALMRVLPNTVIAAPADPGQVADCMRWLVDNPGPSYLRLGKAGESAICNRMEPTEPGKLVPIKLQNSTRAVVVTGTAAQKLQGLGFFKDKLTYDILSVPLWSMATKSALAGALAKYDEIVSFEDHLQDGGFGSYIAEGLISIGASTALTIKAFDRDLCGLVGSQSALEQFGWKSKF